MSAELDKCPECRGRDIYRDYDTGDVVCRGCGLVIDTIVITPHPAYSSSEEPKHRSLRGPALISFSKTSPLNGVADTGLMRELGRTASPFRKTTPTPEPSTEDRNANVIMGEITKTCFRIRLPKVVVDEAGYIYRDTVKKRNIRGRPPQGIAAACVYIACRRLKMIRSLEEVCLAADISKKEGGRSYRFMVDRIGRKTPRQEHVDYVSKFCADMDLGAETRVLASRFAQMAVDLRLTGGKGPAGVAAAAVYVANILLEEMPLTQGEVALGADVTEVTIRGRYRDMMSRMDFIIHI